MTEELAAMDFQTIGTLTSVLGIVIVASAIIFEGKNRPLKGHSLFYSFGTMTGVAIAFIGIMLRVSGEDDSLGENVAYSILFLILGVLFGALLHSTNRKKEWAIRKLSSNQDSIEIKERNEEK